jgi:hypothetical protein
MSDKSKVLRARDILSNFVMKMLASQAHNGLHDGDPPCPSLQVTHEAMLGRFLSEHPDLKPFRTELRAYLAKFYACLPAFPVNRTRWGEVAPA